MNPEEPANPANETPTPPPDAGTFAPFTPPPAPEPQKPAWSYFLLPGAIVIGAVLIAAVLFITRTSDNNTVPASEASPAAESSPAAGASPAAAAPATFSAAVFDYANTLGLERAPFEQCMGDAERARIIQNHLALGTSLGVNGTPTFYINNKKVVGTQPPAIFQEIINLELSPNPPTSLAPYSANIQALASSNPPRFEIVAGRPDLTGAAFKGSKDARVVIAEFSDFQCPFCKRWTDETYRLLSPSLGQDVSLAFLHFPLLQIHPNAGAASMAAICAGEQGKFWEMHDLLFARQSTWEKYPLR